jgi:hypothetical protein
MTDAEESKQVQRAREKIAKKHAKDNSMIDQRALDEMKQAIKHRIDRYSKDRIPLKSKQIALFDENKHIAKIRSKFVKNLENSLRKEAESTPTFNKLIGRVKQ